MKRNQIINRMVLVALLGIVSEAVAMKRDLWVDGNQGRTSSIAPSSSSSSPLDLLVGIASKTAAAMKRVFRTGENRGTSSIAPSSSSSSSKAVANEECDFMEERDFTNGTSSIAPLSSSSSSNKAVANEECDFMEERDFTNGMSSIAPSSSSSSLLNRLGQCAEKAGFLEKAVFKKDESAIVKTVKEVTDLIFGFIREQDKYWEDYFFRETLQQFVGAVNSAQEVCSRSADFHDAKRKLMSLLPAQYNQLQVLSESEISTSPTQAGNELLCIAAKELNPELVKFFQKGIADASTCDKDGRTPLHYLANNDVDSFLNLAIARLLISHGASAYAKDKSGKTPLDLTIELRKKRMTPTLIDSHHQTQEGKQAIFTKVSSAALKRDIDTLRFLSLGGASLYGPSSGYTVLHEVMKEHPSSTSEWELKKEFLEKLISFLHLRGVTIDAYADKYGTPLCMAIRSHSTEAVQFLLDKGASTNVKIPPSRDPRGHTPLHVAANIGDLEVVKLLLENNANVNAKTEDGMFPISVVENKHFKEIAPLLLEKMDDTCRDGDGFTPLYWATQAGNSKIIKGLIESKKIDVNVKSKCDLTPLHVAAKIGDLEVVKLLLENNADVNAKTEDGMLPISMVENKHFKEIAPLLLEKMDPTCRDGDGFTPLHWAARAGNIEVVNLLLENNADVNAKTKDGSTPLHWATQAGNIATVKGLIESKKIDVNVKNKYDLTPLHMAAIHNAKNMVLLLLEYGADPSPLGFYNGIPPQIAVTPHKIAVANKFDDIAEIFARFELKQKKTSSSSSSSPTSDQAREICKKWEVLYEQTKNKKAKGLMVVNKSPELDDQLCKTVIDDTITLAVKIDKVKELLKQGANPVCKTSTGMTPIQAASNMNEPDILGELIWADLLSEFL